MKKSVVHGVAVGDLIRIIVDLYRIDRANGYNNPYQGQVPDCSAAVRTRSMATT
jgi:hypothetical protein